MTHLGQYEPCKTENIKHIIKHINSNEVCVCKICGHIGNRIDNHLKWAHNITTAEYKEKYDFGVLSKKIIDKNINTLNIERKKLWKTDWFREIHSGDKIKKTISDAIKYKFEHDEEYRTKIKSYIPENTCIGKRFKRGWYFSNKNNLKFYYQSGFELEAMKIFEDCSFIKSWIKNSKKYLLYKNYYENEKRYIYDFEIILNNNKRILIETKQYPDINMLYKLYALDKYCKDNNLIWALITTKKELNKFLEDSLYEYINTNGRRRIEI
jgi:hypothetical protein